MRTRLAKAADMRPLYELQHGVVRSVEDPCAGEADSLGYVRGLSNGSTGETSFEAGSEHRSLLLNAGDVSVQRFVQCKELV